MHLRHCVSRIGLPLTVLAGCFGLGLAEAREVPAELINYPDAIYMNATILTLDDHEMNSDPGTVAEAMAVEGDTVLKLGSNDEILKLAGPETEVVDLQGKTVLPGIVESHVHPMGPSLDIARDLFKLRSTPEGYALNLEVGATADETMARVAEAMKQLLAKEEPRPEEWINVSLLHSPELGFASPADVSTLMSAPRLADVKITRADISEIVPNYPFVLSSASQILSAPENNVWYHITVGPDGAPITKPVVKLTGSLAN